MKKIWSLVLTLLVLCMAGSALADGTHTVVDHGGNEVEVPDKITRVVIDQIPILSTYMSYFGGEAPYIVGFCGSFKTTISETVLKNIAPELMETADTVYAQSDLNIEEIMKLEPDVILYNANNASHAEILKASGIPCVGFATVGVLPKPTRLSAMRSGLSCWKTSLASPARWMRLSPRAARLPPMWKLALRPCRKISARPR